MRDKGGATAKRRMRRKAGPAPGSPALKRRAKDVGHWSPFLSVSARIAVMVGLWQFALVVLFAGAGAYLGSYLKRKGENLATHEDVGKLVEQMSAVTKATKEIEAAISDDIWDRQKRWELRREVLFETAKKIAAVRAALFNMSVVYSLGEKEGKDDPARQAFKNEASEKVLKAGRDFDQAILLAELACGKQVTRLLIAHAGLTRRVAREISSGESDAFEKRTKELLAQEDAITAAMREEIGVDGTS